MQSPHLGRLAALRALRRHVASARRGGIASIDLSTPIAVVASWVAPEWALLGLFTAGALAGALLREPRLRRRLRDEYERGCRTALDSAANTERLLSDRLIALERDLTASEQRAHGAEQRLRQELQRLAELADGRARAETRAASAEQHLEEQQVRCRDLEARCQALTGELRELSERLSGSEAQHAAERRAIGEREQLLQRTEAALMEQLEALASRLYEEKGKAISERAQANLETVVAPLKDQLHQFRDKVEQAQLAETRERASLMNEVRGLKSASDRVNAEAANLARALKGDKRLQGAWGEMILERVLEDSGLTRDREYRVQPVLRDGEGDAKRPDVIVRLPGGRDVVVDAKTSLVAWEQALAAGRDEDADGVSADECLDRFAGDVRRQVKRLSGQNYEDLPGVRSLDFTLLFIPIEAALAAVLRHDSRLWNDAFARRVVIVSPTTLMLTLRIIENLWRSERQHDNAREIAARAGAIYDKVRLVVEELERLGSHLQRAGSSYSEVRNRLRGGRGNLVRQVEQLRELGAEVKRPIDAPISRDAMAEIDVLPRLEVVAPQGSDS